jgi:hypothetical protein
MDNPYIEKRKREIDVDRNVEIKQPSSSSSSSQSPADNDDDDNINYDNFNNKDPKLDVSSVSANASALIISAADKAGMDGIDRSKIDGIILRESGDSLYMQQQRRRDEKVNQRVQQMKQRLEQASPHEYKVSNELDEKIREYQRRLPNRSTRLVLDMDMFYMGKFPKSLMF